MVNLNKYNAKKLLVKKYTKYKFDLYFLPCSLQFFGKMKTYCNSRVYFLSFNVSFNCTVHRMYTKQNTILYSGTFLDNLRCKIHVWQILYFLNKGKPGTHTRKNILTSEPIIFCGSEEENIFLCRRTFHRVRSGGQMDWESREILQWRVQVGHHNYFKSAGKTEPRYDIIITSRLQVWHNYFKSAGWHHNYFKSVGWHHNYFKSAGMAS
jgi:hypothetical protein